MHLEIKECIFTPLRIAGEIPEYCNMLIDRQNDKDMGWSSRQLNLMADGTNKETS